MLYQRALNITPLNKEETEKLNIASSIILLTSKMQQFLDNSYDLKKQTHLNELSNLIKKSKQVNLYSFKLRNQTKLAENLYKDSNKFISVKINSSTDYFIKLEQRNLGSFEILNLELRPGNYKVEIKRKKQTTKFLQLFINSNNLNQEYSISCNRNECVIF